MNAFHPLVPAALLLSGCLWPFYGTGSACGDGLGDIEGSITFGDETLSPALDRARLDAQADGECVLAATVDLSFGQGCDLYLEADGAGPRLSIYDINLSGEEGCGFENSGWAPVDVDDASIEVDGMLEPTDSEHTWCYDGDLTVVPHMTLERDGETVEVTGEVVVSGVYVADSVVADCE